MRRRERGLTVVEGIVWVGVFIAAMLALMTTLVRLNQTNRYAIEQASAVASVQRSVDRSVEMMREAAYASNGAYPIVTIDPHTFAFYVDIDEDVFLERVRLFVDDTTFRMGVVDWSGDITQYGGPEAVSIVSSHVRNITEGESTFTYYDEDGAEITDFDRVQDVRFVSMTFVVTVEEERLPSPLTLRSSAALRNLKQPL